MKNNTIAVETNLSVSHTEENVQLNKILLGRLKRLARNKNHIQGEKEYYWPAEFYGLNKSSLFIKASEEQQDAILLECSRHLLQEAYFIEKSGLSYCAKMVLLSETTEMAQVYSLIGADEATHLQWITPYVETHFRADPKGEFLAFLAQLIEEGDQNSLAYLLQIIMEGWGMEHYRYLANYCNDLTLKSVFIDIVRDESLHHSTGIVVFQPNELNQFQKEFIQDSVARFIEMVEVGPQAIVSCVDLVLGDLNKQDRMKLIEQISGPEMVAEKVKLLKQLMSLKPTS